MPDHTVTKEEVAGRTFKCPDLGQIPLEALIQLASAFEEGEPKYGLHNYRKGLYDFAWRRDSINHGLKHAYLHINGDRSENHLGKVLFAFAVEALFEMQGAQFNLANQKIVKSTHPQDQAGYYEYTEPNATKKEIGKPNIPNKVPDIYNEVIGIDTENNPYNQKYNPSFQENKQRKEDKQSPSQVPEDIEKAKSTWPDDGYF